MRQPPSLIPVLLWVAAALAACAPKPTVDYDTGYPFAAARSFYIIPNRIDNEPLMGPRVEQAIRGELGARGLSEADTRAGADIAVQYSVTPEQRPNNTRVSIGLGTGGYGSRGGASVGGSVSAPIGGDTLLFNLVRIDLFPGDRDQLIWRSSEAFEVRGTPQRRADDAQRTVQRLLSRFPPDGS